MSHLLSCLGRGIFQRRNHAAVASRNAVYPDAHAGWRAESTGDLHAAIFHYQRAITQGGPAWATDRLIAVLLATGRHRAAADLLANADHSIFDGLHHAAVLTLMGDDAAACDQYEAASGNQWSSQLGASLGILEAGVEALKASGNPRKKADVAKAINTLKTTTINGKVDFTSGPVAGVASAPLIGTQWVSAKSGGKHKFDLVITENAGDPNVPVSSKLVSYS